MKLQNHFTDGDGNDIPPVSSKLCKLESCSAPFLTARPWMEFCCSAHRVKWNQSQYCGHGKLIGTCKVAACQTQILFEKVQMFETRFSQCRCGRYFERKQKSMVNCSKECRYKAKHEAERKRKAA